LTLHGWTQLSAWDGKIGITHCDDVRGQRAKANKAGEYLTAPLLCVALLDLKTQPKSTTPFLRAAIFDEIEDVRTTLVTFMQQRT
jgi:hypothetical protein